MIQTIHISILIWILLIHFLADFVLQTSDQALNKSTSLKALTHHVLTYSAVIFLGAYSIYGSWLTAFTFSFITFIFHWFTDLVTSKITKNYFDKQDYHNGFVVVGADQVLHYIQLFITYMLLASPLN